MDGSATARRVATRHLDYRHTQRPVLSVILTLLLFPFFLYLSFVAHEEMRKLIETMPHPTRVDSLSWKLKYFYESCTALEHIVVPEQKLIRVIDQMGMEMHTLSLFSFITIRYLSFLPYPLELIAISQYFEMEREILYKINVNLYTLYNMCVGRFSVMMESKICFFFLFLFSMDWNNAGGWGVLRSFSVYSWNFRMVLRRLHAEYGVNAFFRVDVVAHPNFPDKSIVRVSFSFLSFSFLDIFANSVECVCLVESPFAWRFGPGWLAQS